MHLRATKQAEEVRVEEVRERDKTVVYEYRLTSSDEISAGYHILEASQKVWEYGNPAGHTVRVIGGSGLAGQWAKDLFTKIRDNQVTVDPIHLHDMVRDWLLDREESG